MDESSLYTYEPHPTAHDPININEAHRAERNYNHYIAKAFMTVLTALPLFWVVLIICTLWLSLNGSHLWRFDLFPYPLLGTVVSVLSLALMLLITIGQEMDFRHQELVAEELYNSGIKSEHNIVQILNHLSKQDELIIQTAHTIERIEQIEQSEVLKISDAIVEVLTLVREHDAILKALPTTRGRTKA